MIDVDTPVYLGYDSTLKAYRFRVNGRWSALCGGKFCWPSYRQGDKDLNIGSDDAVRIWFGDTVEFKKFSLRTFDSCKNRMYNKSGTYTGYISDEAGAFINDEVFVSWQKTVAHGGVTNRPATCRQSTLPTSRYTFGSARGLAAHSTYWANLKARSFTFDVWINPRPSKKRCYDRLYVTAGYTHTWSTEKLSWSVGVSYPFGVGVGVGMKTDDGRFSVNQGDDGYPDPALTTPRVCRH